MTSTLRSPTPPIRGRTLFAAFRPLLRCGILCLRFLPRRACVMALAAFRHMPSVFGIALRYMLVARLARRCGDNVAVFEGAYLYELENISIGHNVSIHEMCYVSGAGGISIGDDVGIAHGTTIMSTEHCYSDPSVPMMDAGVERSQVTIGSDVWIGCGVRILAGVSVGDHTVIGAGSVVVRSIPAGSLAAGVPARVLKSVRDTTYAACHSL